MREIISTERAPRAIGPYSQAVRAQGLVFVSGQIALDPATGAVTEGGVVEQTERVLENIKAILEAAGSSLEKVLRTTVYLQSMSDFKAMNEVYARYFPKDPPARSTVEVSRLPRDVRIEMDVIALAPFF
jgi:2-iminobutanoate/2-iminopropanoate deaminase